MPACSTAETIEAYGCSIVLRRVEGPEARELFCHCQPPGELSRGEAQAEAVYRALRSVLEAEGGSFDSVVSEMLFLRDVQADLAAVRSGRERSLADSESDATVVRAGTLTVEQPPLNPRARLEVSLQALVPTGRSLRREALSARTGCSCAECARLGGLRVQLGAESRVYASGLCGQGENAYEQTLSMFAVAEDLLQQAGMEFRDVVRAWIHLGEMERDYAALNRARRAFFAQRGIDPVPASTGIGGSPPSESHELCLGIYAVKGGATLAPAVMTSPTLNEAGTYGADFVRGMKSVETNRVALHVSGTASIDEAGRTAHVGDFEAQVDRMLVNVAALLKGQGAGFGDIVSGVTYLKHVADADRLRSKFHEAGFEGFPNALVEAEVCRPELLCETEVLAVLPRPGDLR